MNDRNRSDIDTIIQNGYSVDINAYIQRGWEICQGSLGLFIGFFLITIAIGGALGMIPGGSLVSGIIGGPLNAGSLIVAFKLMKSQPIVFEDFFRGFKSPYFGPTLLVTLVTTLIALACMIPAGVGLFLMGFSTGFSENQQPNPIFLMLAIILTFLGFMALVYISISYTFAIPLVIGRKLEFWSAMEASRKIVGKQWFGIFGFFFVLALINMAGMLACCVGLFVTAPFTSCAIAAAYEHIIGLPDAEDSFA
jgi:hypothetical protein